MGLKRATIAKVVTAAFKAVGDVVQNVTYRRTVSVYTPGTGGMTKTDTDYVVPAILTGFSNYEIDRVMILATDTKMLVESKNLSVVPTAATDSVIADGKTYNIIRYTKDPAGTLLTLHLRAP